MALLQESKFTTTLDRRAIGRGLKLFILLTVAGLTLLFFYTSTPQTLAALRRVQPLYLGIAAVLSAFDLWLGGFRNHIFVRRLKPGVSQWLCFRANIANLFMGAVTPSQSGGGPAQLFILYRGGVPLAGGIAVSVINFLATLVFFLLAASFAMFFIQHKFSQQVVQYLIRYGFLAFSSLFIFFVIALWRPDLLVRFLNRLARLFGTSRDAIGSRISQLGRRLAEKLEHYHETCTLLIRSAPHLLGYSFLLTIVMYTNKFVLAYFVMRGLGVDADFMQMMAIQALILFILYFSPSPGGSGIAEISIGALMSTLMPVYLLPIFTLIQRFFLLYLPAAMGAFVVMADLRPGAKRSVAPPSTAGGRNDQPAGEMIDCESDVLSARSTR